MSNYFFDSCTRSFHGGYSLVWHKFRQLATVFVASGYWQRSLAARVTLFTLAIFVISIWTLSFYVGGMLQEDMQRMLGEQQFQTVSFVAEDIKRELGDRLMALELVAKEIDQPLMDQSTALQERIRQRPILSILFNGGVWISNQDGIVLASNLPTLVGANYAGREYMQALFKDAKAQISKPITGRVLKDAIFVMAAPIRDAHGQTIGVLAGVTDLGKINFLDKVANNRYGKTGGYVLYAPQHRLIVTATDKTRILQPLPPTGANTLLDRYIQGYEGYGVSANSQGVEELTAAKGIPIANWLLAVNVPTAEAFVAVQDLRQRVLLSTLGLSLLAGALVWWILRRQLEPLQSSARALARQTRSGHVQALPVVNPDEIGTLVTAFNHLLEMLRRNEAALADSNTELQRFAEITAHHLQEPARRIASFSDLLGKQLSGKLEDPKAQRSLDFIAQQARYQQNLLRDVQRYLAVGQPRDPMVHVNTRAVLTKTLENLAEDIAAAQAQIAVGDLPAVWFAAARLEDIFEQLLDNALRHGAAHARSASGSGSSGGLLHIGIDGQRVGDMVRFRVSDNGPGIDVQYRERVFLVFERLQSGGINSGIGLALVRRIVASGGGRVWLETTPGGGCTVVFELPQGEKAEQKP